nr:hypothetical protein [Tanacetum cinerariifolium]
MKALLEQQGLAAVLEELPAATIVAYENVIQKKAYITLILCLGDWVLRDITKETTAAGIWKKLETLYMIKSLANCDLAAIDTAISDVDQVLLLLTSLPSSYDNFVETLLYGRDTLKLEDGEIWLERYGAGNEDQISGSGADEYDNADVMIAMGGNILLGDGRECRVRRTSKVQVQMRDGSSFVLYNVRYAPELRQNLISFGTLEKEGFTVKMQSGKIKVIKVLVMALSGIRTANYVHPRWSDSDRKTLKGRKQLGEYQTRWKIKKGNVLDSCNQRYGFNVGVARSEFEVEPHEDHSFEVEPPGNVDHVAGLQEVQTQDLIYYQLARDREQHSTHELFSYREDNNETGFVVTTVEKIYAHESLTFNNTVAYEVISVKPT